MSSPILVTKLYIPPPGPQLVARPRLLERLNEARQRKLTLISAPAGFGKTTLVSNWIQQLKDEQNLTSTDVNKVSPSGPAVQFIWLSLDEADNDPVRFMTYFITALQQLENTLGQSILDSLQTTAVATTVLSSAPDYLITPLINDIATVNIPCIFILDDYHLIETQAIQQAIIFLLEHQPPQLHLIITTRADPPLPLARLRARGQAADIRADDLRFNPAEAMAFLKQITGLDLSLEQITALENRTEGWIAGLQLAALSLQGQSESQVDTFLAAFRGDDRYIVDYLVEEVFNQQTPFIQNFLLQTAILERLSGPLCDAVLDGGAKKQETGLTSSQGVLEYLEQANLFIIPLDNKRQWYRYHHLFGDLLGHRLHQIYPERVKELHCRASQWYEKATLFDEAIRHALAAEDFDYTADLIETYAQTLLWEHGNTQTLLTWFEILPNTIIHTRPMVIINYCWVLFEIFTDREADIRALVAVAEAILPDRLAAEQDEAKKAELQTSIAETQLILANLARRDNDTSQALHLAQQALALLPKDSNLIRAGTTLTIAATYDSLGQSAKAKEIYLKGIALAHQFSNSYIILINVAKLIDVLAVQGQLQEALILVQKYWPLMENRLGPDAGMIYINAGQIFRELNDFEQAEHCLNKGVELCKPFEAMALMVVQGYLGLAWLKHAQGEAQQARLMLQKAEAYAAIDPMLYPAVRMQAMQTRLLLAQGNLTAATHWLTQQGFEQEKSEELTLSYLHEIDHLTLVRVLIAQHKADRALFLLTRLQTAAQTGGRAGRLIEIHMLKALAHQAQGQTQQALPFLAQALQAAEAEGYIRLFVDEGQPMASLLNEMTNTTYIDKLVTLFPNFQHLATVIESVSTPKTEAVALIDPLTKRELKTLRLLATELSIPEIAAEMVVAVSTIRSHTKSIYSKLGVHSRFEAIQKAQTLELH